MDGGLKLAAVSDPDDAIGALRGTLPSSLPPLRWRLPLGPPPRPSISSSMASLSSPEALQPELWPPLPIPSPIDKDSPAEFPEETSAGDLYLNFKLARGSDPPIGASPSRRHPIAYNQMMKAFGHAGEVDQVLRLLREMKDSDLTPNVFCYNTAINSLVSADRRVEAEELFEEMKSSGVRPNVASYNILVKMYSCYSFQFDKACSVIDDMVINRLRPDSTTYSTLITGLCRVGRIDEALDFVAIMWEENCPPSVQTFTAIVHGFCLQGNLDDARRFMEFMDSKQCPPNVVTYNVFVEALCKVGRFDQVEKVLEESKLKGWKPNVVTYNTYMNGLCKWGKARDAFGLLKVMLENGLCPTVVTLNILLECLCQESNFLEVKYLLERSYELKWDIGVVGYNTVMSRLSDVGRWWDVLKLFVDMVKKGINPNTRTFNIFIHCLCKAGNLCLAKHLFYKGGFVADVVTYNTLIHWFYLERNEKEVQALRLKMVAEGVSPNIITYSILIKGLCRGRKFSEATNLFLGSFEMTDWEVVELLNLLEGMGRQGFTFDAFVFNGIIRALCRKGSCQSGDLLCLTIDKILTFR
ncbi:TPR-like protein [Dioscorea alata]|uniref:TPR-like protein n=1 Tax=Dioscorea alata TaxID=55571 RepID=A0ACB7V0K4_DIOAL|nr:TPR-like protein [Dioscorea alata]